MIQDGSLAPSDASSHPARNVVTRALGLEGLLEVDVWTEPPAAETTYLICSDGLINEVNDSTLDEVLGAGGSPQEIADALVALALEAGARDNVSVVIATIDTVGGAATSPDDDTNPRGVLLLATDQLRDDDPTQEVAVVGGTAPLGPDGLVLGPPPGNEGSTDD
jgi:protein phosphatase